MEIKYTHLEKNESQNEQCLYIKEKYLVSLENPPKGAGNLELNEFVL